MRHLVRALCIVACAAALFGSASAQSPTDGETAAIRPAQQTRLVVLEAFMRTG